MPLFKICNACESNTVVAGTLLCSDCSENLNDELELLLLGSVDDA